VTPGNLDSKREWSREGCDLRDQARNAVEGAADMDENTTVGDRIRYWRKRRKLSQQVLAGLVGRSAVWLSQIERGVRPIDKLSILQMLANVLKVELGDLIGAIKLPVNGGAALDPPAGIPAIRRALLAVDPPDREPLAHDRLRERVEQAKKLRHAGRYEPVGVVVPELLMDARATAAAADASHAWWCLAGAYQVTSALLRTVGEVELAWIAADRGIATAQRSGDPFMVSVSECVLALVLLRAGLLDDAGAVCSDGADRLAPVAGSPLAAWTMWGALQLTEAVAAARRQELPHVARLLRDARAGAKRVGPGPKPYWAAFGPANVEAYEITIALEAGDVSEALRIADRLDVEELSSPERRAETCVTVAHAHSLRNDDPAAVSMLLEAERHAAQEVRYSVLAHTLVRVCLSRERKSRTPALRALAERIHVTD